MKLLLKRLIIFSQKTKDPKSIKNIFSVIWSDAEIVLQCSLMTDVGSNDQQLAPSSDCASLTVHNTTTPFAQLFDLCCKNIAITCLTQPPVTNHPRLEAGVQCHLGVIFTAFFVPWLDGWQGHSGWIVKWPPEKVLNSLRLPATLRTLCQPTSSAASSLISRKHAAVSPFVRFKAFVPAQNDDQQRADPPLLAGFGTDNNPQLVQQPIWNYFAATFEIPSEIT